MLCIDAVEISTSGGHYLALDMPAAPYPLAGEPRDVVDDVARLGGFGAPAHPDSPKPELRWHEWDAPFPGMEIVNPDTGWRATAQDAGWEPKLRLMDRLFSYPFRPAESMASFVAASPENLARWETLTRRRSVIALAGADAHAKLALKSSEPGDNRFSVALPSYQASFETLSVHVRPDAALSNGAGDAAADAAAILHGIRAGHLYIAVDGLASPPSFTFTADSGGKTAGEGDTVAAGSPTSLHVRSNAPSTYTTTIWEGNQPINTSREPDITVKASGAPAVYRVEIRASQPLWLMSNPIYVRSSALEQDQLPDRAPATQTTSILEGRTATAWRVEHDRESTAVLDKTPGDSLRLTYQLATGRSPQNAALLTEIPGGVGSSTRLTFTARADRPMRVSVQLRTGLSGMPEERWQRSVYLDATDRDQVVRFDDLTPVGNPRTSRPALNEIRYVLFVVDTTNTKPGRRGRSGSAAPSSRALDVATFSLCSDREDQVHRGRTEENVRRPRGQGRREQAADSQRREHTQRNPVHHREHDADADAIERAAASGGDGKRHRDERHDHGHEGERDHGVEGDHRRHGIGAARAKPHDVLAELRIRHLRGVLGNIAFEVRRRQHGEHALGERLILHRDVLGAVSPHGIELTLPAAAGQPAIHRPREYDFVGVGGPLQAPDAFIDVIHP